MEYAQARMQARHGERPDEALWRQLAGHREFADYLAAVRATGLARWVAGMDVADGPHAIERTLRRHWRGACAEVAHWLPLEWRAATDWAAVLIDLPAHAYLAQGGQAPEWMLQDPGLAPLTAHAAPAGSPPDNHMPCPRHAWLTAWRARWPTRDTEQARQLRQLTARVEEHLAQLAESDPARAWEARRALGRRVAHFFRACAGQPPAAFAHLLLQALDLERLRAELLDRALHRRHTP